MASNEITVKVKLVWEGRTPDDFLRLHERLTELSERYVEDEMVGQARELFAAISESVLPKVST